MIIASQAIQESFVLCPDIDVSSLKETLYQGAELMRKLLLQRVGQPDFYTVQRDDTEEMYLTLEDVSKEIQVAFDGGFVHFCAQAHYLLPIGDGETSITLFLADE